MELLNGLIWSQPALRAMDLKGILMYGSGISCSFFHCAAREQKVRDWLINEKPPPVGEGYGVNAGGDQAAGGSVPSGGFAASPVVSSS